MGRREEILPRRALKHLSNKITFGLIGSELRVTSLQGEIQEFFIGAEGGPNFGSEGTVELFYGKLLFPHTPSH